MSVTEDYLANNAEYAKTFTGPLPMPPSKHVAVVACMDARLTSTAFSASKTVRRTSSGMLGVWSPMTRSVRWLSASGCWAPRRSFSSTTPTAAC